MKQIILIYVSMIPFMTSAQQKKIEVPDSILQNVVKTAFEYIKVTFPADELSVSYCFEETDYGFPFNNYLTGKNKQLAIANNIELTKKDYKLIDPIYSTMLFDTFNVHNSNLKNPKYEVWFAMPLGHMIICNIYDFGERESIWGEYTSYLFTYYEYAEDLIDMMIKSKIIRN